MIHIILLTCDCYDNMMMVVKTKSGQFITSATECEDGMPVSPSSASKQHEDETTEHWGYWIAPIVNVKGVAWGKLPKLPPAATLRVSYRRTHPDQFSNQFR